MQRNLYFITSYSSSEMVFRHCFTLNKERRSVMATRIPIAPPSELEGDLNDYVSINRHLSSHDDIFITIWGMKGAVET